MDIDLVSRTVRADTDRPWREVEHRLGRAGLTLGWLPPIGGSDTIGSIVSTAARGLRSTLYGTPTDNCVAVEAWVKGKRERTPVVPRSAAGADFRHLTFGTENRHAPLTGVWLRAHLKPEAVYGLSIHFQEANESAMALAQIMQRGAWPAVAMVNVAAAAVTCVLQFEGTEPITKARCQAARRLMVAAGGVEKESDQVVEKIKAMDEGALAWKPPPNLPWGAELSFSGTWATVGLAAEAVIAAHRECEMAITFPTQHGADLMISGLEPKDQVTATAIAVANGVRHLGAYSMVNELFTATIGSMAEHPQEGSV